VLWFVSAWVAYSLLCAIVCPLPSSYVGFVALVKFVDVRSKKVSRGFAPRIVFIGCRSDCDSSGLFSGGLGVGVGGRRSLAVVSCRSGLCRRSCEFVSRQPWVGQHARVLLALRAARPCARAGLGQWRGRVRGRCRPDYRC